MAQPGSVLVSRIWARVASWAPSRWPCVPYICAIAPVSRARWAGVNRSRCRWTDATSIASSEAW